MKFQTICTDESEKAFFALEFLKEAFKNDCLNQIENMDEILNALDISQELAYCQKLLNDHYIIVKKE